MIEQPDAESSAEISLKEFLETIPPSKWMVVSNAVILRADSNGSGKARYLNSPRLMLPCDSEICSGTRSFRPMSEHRFFKDDVSDFFVEYVCANCTRTKKRFALCVRRSDLESADARLYKYGEEPSFGPSTPARLLRLFGEDQHLFVKGRRCESQALGVGAFAYYRRVVEAHKDQILDEIRKVAIQVDADPECIRALEQAKKATQFSSAVESVKSAIPQSLLIKGQNPLTLLHSALSIGLHEATDETCLELAHAVRIVLIELADRISSALKDEAELGDAVARLMQAQNPKNKAPVKPKPNKAS